MHGKHKRLAPVLVAALLCSLGSQARALEAGARYRVDPSSARAGFDLGATLHTVHGGTKDVRGDVRIEAPSPEGFSLSGKISIAVSSLDTGNDRRDRKMREESLAALAHPEIVFLPKKLTAGKPDPAEPSRRLHDLSGTLEIRGVAKGVVIPVSVQSAGGRLRVDGRLDVRLADFGIPDPSVFVLRVEPVAHASFHIELVP